VTADAGQTILVLNAGSSSVKLGLFDAAGETRLAERSATWADGNGEVAGYRAAVGKLLEAIDVAGIAAVGHRLVHGGAHLTRAVVIDERVRAEITALTPLAPLHNPAALEVIAAVTERLPDVPQVAVFDTAFHATLPEHAATYAVPFEWRERWGVRRFGFHGLSHAYCATRAADLLGRPLETLKLVTCHLGSGCSLAAVQGGRSIATTMGYTPLDGLVMATRPGSVDPGLLTYLLAAGHLTLGELEDAINDRSGLKGVSGLSGDMREIVAARAAEHERATLAFDLFVTRLAEGIAAMTTHLAGLDALVFTAGIGENSPEVRAAACDRLAWMGSHLDCSANTSAVPDRDLATANSPVRILVIHTREDLMVARATARVLVEETAGRARGTHQHQPR
jgi:acetate kinase